MSLREQFIANAEEAEALIPQAATVWLKEFYRRQNRFWRRMAERVS